MLKLLTFQIIFISEETPSDYEIISGVIHKEVQLKELEDIYDWEFFVLYDTEFENVSPIWKIPLEKSNLSGSFVKLTF